MTGSPGPAPPEDADVGEDVRAERFRGLFGAHFRDLLGYALRRVDAAEDAADVVAETMLVAWRRIDEVPPGAEARLWLYGVSRRVLANERRGEVRRRQLGERLRRALAEALPDPAETVASVTTVRSAMARLGDEDRELIALTGWEGLTPTEAATVLGIASGTVRTRLYRARARLRKELGDDWDRLGHDQVDRHPRVVREER